MAQFLTDSRQIQAHGRAQQRNQVLHRPGAGLFRLALVGVDLFFQLRDHLPRVGERIGFAVEPFVTMATDAAAILEEVFAEVERIRAL